MARHRCLLQLQRACALHLVHRGARGLCRRRAPGAQGHRGPEPGRHAGQRDGGGRVWASTSPGSASWCSPWPAPSPAWAACWSPFSSRWPARPHGTTSTRSSSSCWWSPPVWPPSRGDSGRDRVLRGRRSSSPTSRPGRREQPGHRALRLRGAAVRQAPRGHARVPEAAVHPLASSDCCFSRGAPTGAADRWARRSRRRAPMAEAAAALAA